MLVWEAWAFSTLHKSSRVASILGSGRFNANIAAALLHDDAQDDTLINANLCRFADGVKNTADILTGIARS